LVEWIIEQSHCPNSMMHPAAKTMPARRATNITMANSPQNISLTSSPMASHICLRKMMTNASGNVAKMPPSMMRMMWNNVICV